jgi:D-sedoheptulose 7-phosphate isomerase
MLRISYFMGRVVVLGQDADARPQKGSRDTGTPPATSPAQEIGHFLDQAQRTVAELDQRVLDEILDCLMDVWRERRTVFVMGNGGSASTATHFAADLAKYTISEGKPRFKVLGLTDNVPLVSAWTNDGGFNSIFAEQMAAWLEPGDVLVGFSVHGGSGSGEAGPWSQNMVRAMKAAKDGGASVIGFSGFDGGAMAEMADYCLTVPVLTEELGTPIVESIHVLLHHLVVHTLRERIKHA